MLARGEGGQVEQPEYPDRDLKQRTPSDLDNSGFEAILETILGDVRLSTFQYSSFLCR